MIKFECRSCKHFPKGKCYWCGLTKRDYKKSHPEVYRNYLDLYGIFRAMVKFRMERTGCTEVDKEIHSIWGNPISFDFMKLDTVEKVAR